MANVEIRGLDELVRGLGDLRSNSLPFALAKTLTNVATIAKENTVNEMRNVFDRPTPYTLNSLTIKVATKQNLQSKVQLKDNTLIGNQNHYLNPEVTGGLRAFKPFEKRLFRRGVLPHGYYTVPASGADFDAFGNMNRGQITQILSFFDSFSEAGFGGNMGAAGRTRLSRGTARRYGIAYFAIQPGGNSRLHPGIYKRINSNFGSAIKPVLLFVRNVTYRKRLDIQRIADKTYSQNFNRIFIQNFNDAINDSLPR
jgi:hypothetical protein